MMIRNLKVFGLALAAVFAFAALSASVASAQEQGELTADGPVTLTGIETGGAGANGLTAFGQTVECPGSTYTGHRVLTPKETEEGKEHQFLQPGDTEITITPHYKQEGNNCRTASGLFMTITTNGCDFVFHLGNTTPAGNKDGTYGVTVDLVCPKGSPGIQMHIYLNAAHTTQLCTLTVGPQNGLVGLHATHTPSEGDFDIEGEITTTHMSHPTEPCGAAATINNAKVKTDVTVEAHDELGLPTDVTITD